MENKKLYKKVASAVAEAIHSGRYAPGERLPTEREFVEEFGVSRPTVREAMLVLEVQGLVEPRHGSGIYVVPQPAGGAAVDVEIGAIELIEARALVEGDVAALAATEITDQELEDLEVILVRMAKENEAQYLDAELADRDFHMAIARATHNDVLVSVVEAMWNMRDRAPLANAMLSRARQNGLKPAISEHRALLVALRAHDPVAAKNAMRDHLHRVIDSLLDASEIEAVERTRAEIRTKKAVAERRRRL